MSRLSQIAKVVGVFCLVVPLALAANAAGPEDKAGAGAQPAVPDVVVPESTVLPNAPNVGDTAPAAPSLAPKSSGAQEETPAAKANPSEVKGNPDWPCIQRKVLSISPAQVWDGPSLDDAKGWENDDQIQELTTYLESRRIPIEDAEKAIKEFAASVPPAERDKKLTQLFASVLSKINSDREFVMGRIEEFQRRQKARAEEIEREGQKLAALNQQIPAEEQLGPRDAKLTPEQQEYNWNSRIFQERQQNLSVACEIPVLIEQRAFEIARLIRAQMQS